MARQSRTFKLRLSPAGMDLLIDSHCHLIRSTRALLAWGTTLHVAVECLETVPTATLRQTLASKPEAGLFGAEEHHLGASRSLREIVSRISERISGPEASRPPPTIAQIYIVALQHLTRTDAETLCATYERMRTAGGADHRKVDLESS